MKIIAGPLHFLHIKKAKSRMIRGFIRKELKTEKFSHFYFSLIHMEEYKEELERQAKEQIGRAHV